MDDENRPPNRQRDVLHQRKIAKPLMEKRRRERINNCLEQLRSLLTEVTKKEEEEENSYRSKLEKADILEMTVNYLKSIKRQKVSGTVLASNDSPASSFHNKYVAGFRECAEEVVNYLEKSEGLTPSIRSTLLQYLAGRLEQTAATTPPVRSSCIRTISNHQVLQPPHPNVISILPQTPVHTNASLVSCPVQLLPAKLPTGETVYVLANAVKQTRSAASDVVAHDVIGMAQRNQTTLQQTTVGGNTSLPVQTDCKAQLITRQYETISPVASPIPETFDSEENSTQHRQILQSTTVPATVPSPTNDASQKSVNCLRFVCDPSNNNNNFYYYNKNNDNTVMTFNSNSVIHRTSPAGIDFKPINTPVVSENNETSTSHRVYDDKQLLHALPPVQSIVAPSESSNVWRPW